MSNRYQGGFITASFNPLTPNASAVELLVLAGGGGGGSRANSRRIRYFQPVIGSGNEPALVAIGHLSPSVSL